MKLATDIQMIKRDKRLKLFQEIRKIVIPLPQKRNMKKFKSIGQPKHPSELRQNKPVERQGEAMLERLTKQPKYPPKLSSNRLVERNDEVVPKRLTKQPKVTPESSYS